MTKMKEYKAGQFCWVDLMATDMAAAKELYGSLFGWRVIEQDTEGGPRYAEFFQGDEVIAGLGETNEEMKRQGVPPLWTSYVAVDDVEAAAKKAEALGATITLPPMRAAGAGWMAFIKDPTGAHLALWQKNRHAGATLVNEPNSFAWNELSTRDVPRAKAFYGELFGWEYSEMPMGDSATYRVCKNAGRDNGGIQAMPEAAGAGTPPHWMVYFSVADTDGTVARLLELGGKTLFPPMDTPFGRFALVTDAQGAVFALITLTTPPA